MFVAAEVFVTTLYRDFHRFIQFCHRSLPTIRIYFQFQFHFSIFSITQNTHTLALYHSLHYFVKHYSHGIHRFPLQIYVDCVSLVKPPSLSLFGVVEHHFHE